MGDSETGSRFAKQPFGWLKGLVFTLVAGTALASLLPYAFMLAYVANLMLISLRIHSEPQASMWPSPKSFALLSILLVAPAFAIFSFVVVPITLSYAIVRWAARYVHLPLLSRALIGFALGVGAETALPIFLHARGSVWERVIRPHASYMPLLVGSFTGIALGILIRPRWLGLSVFSKLP